MKTIYYQGKHIYKPWLCVSISQIVTIHIHTIISHLSVISICSRQGHLCTKGSNHPQIWEIVTKFYPILWWGGGGGVNNHRMIPSSKWGGATKSILGEFIFNIFLFIVHIWENVLRVWELLELWTLSLNDMKCQSINLIQYMIWLID